jgi:hypothetical protein
LTSGPSITGIDDTGRLTAQGLADANIAANRAAQGIADDEGLGIMRTGAGLAKGVVNSIGTLARADTFKSTSRLQDQTNKRGALIDAIGTVAMAGGSRYASAQNDKKLAAEREEYAQRSHFRNNPGNPYHSAPPSQPLGIRP